MGVYYFYANHDKKQYFSIGLLGAGIKRSSLGRTPGARALSLMLLDDFYWKNDRISVTDDADEIEYERLKTEYQNIDIDATLLLIEKDGLQEYEENFKNNSGTFILLCELADILGNKEISDYLTKNYGSDWRKKYIRQLAQSSCLSSIDKINEYKQRRGNGVIL